MEHPPALDRSELDFAYRSCRTIEPGLVVVSVLLETTPSEPSAVRAEGDRLLAQRADTQPLRVPSCGSVWKNPRCRT